MSRIIKICGITSARDARACLDLGADRLGLIFAHSPRRVSLEQAAGIAKTVPGASLTGVFVGCDPEAAATAVRTAGLTHVQLHDCPDPRDWDRVAEACGRPVIPALTHDRVGAIPPDGPRRTYLLDLAKAPQLRTATHRDELQAAAAELIRRGDSVLVAGGLDPGNVARAVHRTGCTGVDVAGGVESAPGVKDLRLVERFIHSVRGLEYGHVH